MGPKEWEELYRYLLQPQQINTAGQLPSPIYTGAYPPSIYQVEQERIQQEVERQRQIEEMTRWINECMKQQAKPIELPDEFDTWCEEVRKQNRLEELLKTLIKCVESTKSQE